MGVVKWKTYCFQLFTKQVTTANTTPVLAGTGVLVFVFSFPMG